MTGNPQGSESEQRRVIYHGRVQGVGFRYTTASLARNFPVSGFVRNLPDGTVELVAEGRSQDVDDFIGEVSRSFRRHIERCETNEVETQEHFDGFHIRH